MEKVATADDDVCMAAPWLGAAVGLAGLCAILCAGITTILFCRAGGRSTVVGTVSSVSLF